jgi:CheY-like chemotaxis protein
MKILLVEDDVFFQKFYATKIKEKDVEVEVAGDGVEALEKLKAYTPDLILLDLIMPKKDGFEVLLALSQSPTLKDIPVLVFSTLGQEADVKRAKDLGAKDYVNKSFFDFDSLHQKMVSLVQK